ncbi:pectinesterase inhibitor [Rhodamnia argentea]|uniref:Pectinesterase inhibitor n=1 Tax=Rhodamnia argentea TaxID=178133 RepID=A0A8B8MYA2_9MYRT|nr:pectinesterase inhibitor [Rhodamnia argentea]
MGSARIISSPLSCFMLLLLSINFSSSAILERTGSDRMVKDICSKTQDPVFCMQVLAYDPPTKGAALLRSLALFSLDLAQAGASEARIAIDARINSTGDPQLREAFIECSAAYGAAVSALRDADKLLVSGDYVSLRTRASGVAAQVEQCQTSLKLKQEARQDPIGVKNNDLKRICSIILAISNLLLALN